ncbi:MAG: hypothetical protein HYT88_03290 [Candidatus Omnitrophica bacterium]|nr:hypothetical protein [Candidatus Omnitrophota bacterium]
MIYGHLATLLILPQTQFLRLERLTLPFCSCKIGEPHLRFRIVISPT